MLPRCSMCFSIPNVTRSQTIRSNLRNRSLKCNSSKDSKHWSHPDVLRLEKTTIFIRSGKWNIIHVSWASYCQVDTKIVKLTLKCHFIAHFRSFLCVKQMEELSDFNQKGAYNLSVSGEWPRKKYQFETWVDEVPAKELSFQVYRFMIHWCLFVAFN